ncbi:MAG: hypothetical protein JNK72_08595 [Myxococcales bacterium]|nr:hypothetical protein [Myxococcales bacterium]
MGAEASLGWDLREAAAEHLLAQAGLGEVVAPPMGAVVAALGWRLAAGAPRGTHGWLDLDAATVHIDDRGDALAVAERIAHELGHLAAMAICAAHDEADADAIGLAMRVPRRGVRETLRNTGWDALRIAASYPEVEPLEALVRVAAIGGGALAVHQGGVRVYAAVGEAPCGAMFPRELTMVQAIRRVRRARPLRDATSGLRAFPMRLGRGDAVVLLASPEVVVEWQVDAD